MNSPQDQRLQGILHSNNKISSCEHQHLVIIQVDCCTLINASPNIILMHDEGRSFKQIDTCFTWLTRELTGSDDQMQ